MERVAKRQKTPRDELSLKLEEKRLQNEELLSHCFSDEISQLLLTEQEWVLDTNLLQGEECTEQIVAEGLMPCSVSWTLSTDVYRINIPFVLDINISSSLGTVSAQLHPSLSLKQMCLVLLLPHMTHNLFEQLYLLKGYFAEKMKHLPLSVQTEEQMKKSIEALVRERNILQSKPNYEEAMNQVRNGVRWERSGSFLSKSTLYPGRPNSVTTYSTSFCQPLFNSPLQLTTDAPLLKHAVDGILLSRTVLLLKLRVIAVYIKRRRDLNVRVLPLTPHEHSLLQKQSRLDGQLPTVLPYGCILYSASDTK